MLSQVYRNSECVDGSQGQDIYGNSSASHVDGRTKRDGDRVGVRIQSQILAEFHIDRDICSRATSEEGCNTTDT